MSLLAVDGLAWFVLALAVGLIVGPMLGALGRQPCQETATRNPQRAGAGRRAPGLWREANERITKIS